MSLYIFLFLAFVSILSGLMVVFSRNPVHSVLYLVVCFFSIAGHYIMLNAQFLAIVHIIVYAGAIMVLFLFVIMLLNLNKESVPRKALWARFAAVISGGALCLLLLAAFRDSQLVATAQPELYQGGLIENLGKRLYTDYVLPFEISSVLFLSAMVGVVMISKKST